MATEGGGAAEVAGSVMPLLLCTFMIVSMQLGFAMLEVGCVRQEHRMTVLAKNLLDTMVSSLSFSLGCAIFQPSIVKQDGVVENHLIFLHWAFLSTAVTICSGSMAERAHLAAYLCYAVLMSGLAYPILADSVWGDGTGAGFLYHQFHPSGGHVYYDYAGAGVIHLAGAMAALAGNSLLGRRILRPPAKELSHTQGQGDDTAQLKEAIQEQWQRRFDRGEDDEKEFRPNSYLQVMGVLNLWVGCYGFNASPAFARRDPHRVEIAALSAWNTTLAAGAGACGTFLHSCIFHKHMQLGFLCNGLLSGLVCLTVACDILTPAATVLLGFLCGFLVYPAGSYALKKMRIDDPADAIPVHGGSAIFGILSVAFCTPSCDTESGSAYGHHFCADHHTIGGQLLVQLLGVGTILVWISCVIFPVWAVFLVSECVYASELEQLSDTYEHACQSVDLEAAKSLEEDFWTGAARNSRIIRHLLRQHGWNWIGSPFKDAAAASDFRQDMVEAIHSSKTALELDGVAVRLLQGIARQLARFRCCRELARIRLRIAPFAELSGLGAMAGTGKEVAEIVREVLEIVTDSHGEERKGGLPLELQVEQLRRQVQNQGVLLQRLSRNKRYAGYRSLGLAAPRLASVTETEPAEPAAEPDLATAATERSNSPKAPSTDITNALPRHEQNVPMLPISSTSSRGRPLQREETGDLAQLHATSAAPRSLTPEERPRREVTSRSLQSASTVSDKSMGLITPRSEGDETPPPTTYGYSYGHRQRRSTVSGQPEAALQVMATQLANLLQAQQRLASSLPDLRNEEFHRQLIAALERRDSRSGSERSSRFEATPRLETGTAPSNV